MAKSMVDVVNQLIADWVVPPDILMVDDEEDILDSFQASMREIGCVAYVAKNGKEALELYKQKLSGNFADQGASAHPFDLIYLDIRMPGMAGDYVLKEIRRLWPDQPIELVTGMHVVDVAMAHPTVLDFGPISINTKPLGVKNYMASLRMHNIRFRPKRNRDSAPPMPDAKRIDDDGLGASI